MKQKNIKVQLQVLFVLFFIRKGPKLRSQLVTSGARSEEQVVQRALPFFGYFLWKESDPYRWSRIETENNPDEETIRMCLINIVSLSLDKYLYLLCQQQR